MRSVVLERLGEPADVLRIERREKPKPGSREVLVRLQARPINPADLLLVRGRYGSAPALPLVPGNEGVGVIEALGAAVDDLAVGTRVICFGRTGTWQESMAVPATHLVPVPEQLAEGEAAQAITNPVSAWLMLKRLRLKKGDWLLQTAAGSALGSIVVQIARLRGIHTINVVRRHEQAARLLELGADEVVVAPDEEVVQRVRAATCGRGATAAIDAVGGDTATSALKAVADGGAMLVYGLLSGEPGRFDNGEMIFRRLTVSGFWLRHWFLGATAGERQEALDPVFACIANGSIQLPVKGRFDLDCIKEAVQCAEQTGSPGKVLLTG
jgi:NADPH:quinone reductase-like Zn-dependent oxidoreductase